jgi:hypothetical protein
MARWIGAALDAKCEDENNKDAKLPELLGNGHTVAQCKCYLDKA